MRIVGKSAPQLPDQDKQHCNVEWKTVAYDKDLELK